MTTHRPTVFARLGAAIGETLMVWGVLLPVSLTAFALHQAGVIPDRFFTSSWTLNIAWAIGAATHLCLVWRWWPFGATRPMTWRGYYIIDKHGEAAGRRTMILREFAYAAPAWVIGTIGDLVYGSGGYGILWVVAGGMSIVSGGKPPWDAITQTDAVAGRPRGRPEPLFRR